MESNYAWSKQQALYQWLSIRLSESCSEIRRGSWKEYPNKNPCGEEYLQMQNIEYSPFWKGFLCGLCNSDHVHHS